MITRRALFWATTTLWGAPAATATVLYDDRETALPNSRLENGDLWVPTSALPAINGFEVKPQGACRADLCIPLPKQLKHGNWLNLTGFARKVRQAFVHEGSLWSFGEMPVLRSSFLQSRVAPDFAVADRKGQPVRLTDFRGRKILLLSWASW